MTLSLDSFFGPINPTSNASIFNMSASQTQSINLVAQIVNPALIPEKKLADMNYNQAVKSLNLSYKTLSSIRKYYDYCIDLNQIPDFSNNNFLFTTLDEINLAGSNLAGCNFQGSSLVNANLANCNLTNANFNIVELQGANLAGSDITGANFNSANFNSASFRNAYTILSSGDKNVVRFEYFEQFSVKGIVIT